MNIAILFTAHRQLAELDYQAEFFRRSHRLKTDLDVVYHCNNAQINETELNAKLAKIPCKSMKLLHNAVNRGGYPYGQFEAICDAYQTLLDGQWDWVIHLHPDIFVVDEVPLFKAIDDAHSAGAALLTTAVFGTGSPSFGTDFFAFRPAAVPKEVFSSFEYLINEPKIVPLEDLFFIEAHRHNVKTFPAQRFLGNLYYRDPDSLGLWHEHKLKRVKAYLQSPELRWGTTRMQVLQHPLKALREAGAWLKRGKMGISQERLAKYWTRI